MFGIFFVYRVVEKSGYSHFVWDEDSAGSNPVNPTKRLIVKLSNKI